MQRMVSVIKALRKPFTDAKLKTMFATCRKLVPRLKGWKLSLNNMHKSAGTTHYDTKRITLARRMLHVFSTKEVIDVILHEIAHAILPYGCAHGVRWKKLHKSFGGNGQTYCRVFFKPQQVFLCKCKTRLSYAPSKLKWCLDCESLERRGRIKPIRICGGPTA